MKILWLCNMIPGAISQHMGRKGSGALWVDHVLEDISVREDIRLHLLCPGKGKPGQLNTQVDYALFSEGKPHKYLPALESQFTRELDHFQPDIIHIWGTEYAHTLAMVNAAKSRNLLNRVVISIQGLCSVYARHFSEGIPEWACRRYTLHDFVKRENINGQRRLIAKQGQPEEEALRQVHHVIGRTDWDKAITSQLNPDCTYHFCNETLRAPFYEDTWEYDKCIKHRIFVSSCFYPVKGFHYLLEALPAILARYPDTTVSVTGSGFYPNVPLGKLRHDYYQVYLRKLAEKNGVTDKLIFLGRLSAQQMKDAYLEANVFAMPSTIENSPNSLGEAMLLGMPCVAADVGGIANMMHPGEGYLYQSTAPYMLAEYIIRVFDQQEQAAQMGRRARLAALKTHDPEKNMSDLMDIYRRIAPVNPEGSSQE